MFSQLDVKIADRILGELRDGGVQGRALKAVRTFRRNPTDDNRDAALTALNALSKPTLAELRQVALI